MELRERCESRRGKEISSTRPSGASARAANACFRYRRHDIPSVLKTTRYALWFRSTPHATLFACLERDLLSLCPPKDITYQQVVAHCQNDFGSHSADYACARESDSSIDAISTQRGSCTVRPGITGREQGRLKRVARCRRHDITLQRCERVYRDWGSRTRTGPRRTTIGGTLNYAQRLRKRHSESSEVHIHADEVNFETESSQ